MDWWAYILILIAPMLIAFLYGQHTKKRRSSAETSVERSWMIGGDRPYQRPDQKSSGDGTAAGGCAGGDGGGD